jgi:hypothetical protein
LFKGLVFPVILLVENILRMVQAGLFCETFSGRSAGKQELLIGFYFWLRLQFKQKFKGGIHGKA